ncbi:hypothetical protein D3C81_1027230 [compost metagenome]
MSAQIIPFPSRTPSQPDPLDALDALMERIAQTITTLPVNEEPAEQLRLLRRIDRKLGDLVKALCQGGAQ